MQTLVEAALDFVATADDLSGPTGVIERFGKLSNLFGFKHFIMTGLPSYGEDVEALIVKNGWPEEWTNRYREQSYFYKDPVSLYALSASKSYTWEQARAESEKTVDAEKVASDARSFQLVDGIAVPMFDPTNFQAVVSFGADTIVDLSVQERSMLQLAAVTCHGLMLEDLLKDGDSRPSLTPRERDVLTWASYGKSRNEIATILDVSISAVNRHVENAIAKLQVRNITQAVCRALRQRQIVP